MYNQKNLGICSWINQIIINICGAHVQVIRPGHCYASNLKARLLAFITFIMFELCNNNAKTKCEIMKFKLWSDLNGGVDADAG